MGRAYVLDPGSNSSKSRRKYNSEFSVKVNEAYELHPQSASKNRNVSVPSRYRNSPKQQSYLESPRRQGMGKKKKSKGGCKGVLHVMSKPLKLCSVPMKKASKLCLAPINLCQTGSKPRKNALVPTPRLESEIDKNSLSMAAYYRAVQKAKLLWFIFRILIVIALAASYDYDPESLYPVRLGLKFWHAEPEEGSLDWF